MTGRLVSPLQSPVARGDQAGVVTLAWRRGAAIVLAIVAVGTLSFGYLLAGRSYVLGEVLSILVAVPMIAVVGAILAVRRPGNRIAWVMLTLAGVFGLASLGYDYALARSASPTPSPLIGVALWGQQFLYTLVAIPVVLFFVWFPDGRPHRRLWSRFLRIWIPLHVAGASLKLLEPGHPDIGGEHFPFTSPFEHELFAVAGALGHILTSSPVLPIVLAVSVLALVDRLRTADSDQSRQIAWVAYSAIPFGLAFAAGEAIAEGRAAEMLWIVTPLLAALVPVTIGIAVLRYRLYEIDRIVSRTVSYGILVVVLGAVYVVGVLGLGAAVSGVAGDAGGELVVAASVLAAVALFHPVRSRVQEAVDRRFNRRGYAAQLVVEAFAERLRDEVDPGEVSHDLARTAAAAVQPTQASVWSLPKRDTRSVASTRLSRAAEAPVPDGSNPSQEVPSS